MNRLYFSLLLLCLSVLATDVSAKMSSFVADAVQAVPGQEQRRGKLYVSDLGTRFEFTSKKQKVIQIIQPKLGLFRLLFPKTKTYFEIRSPSSRLTLGRRAKAPCKPTAKIECYKQGEVKSGAMSLERWYVKDKDEKTSMRVWWDPKRHMFIRQLFQDGTKMVAQMQGSRRFEGRKVEQWKMTVFMTTGIRLDSYMLFAPDLGFPVMEQGGNGLVKELHNIKAYPEDPSLYELPAKYKKIRFPENNGTGK